MVLGRKFINSIPVAREKGLEMDWINSIPLAKNNKNENNVTQFDVHKESLTSLIQTTNNEFMKFVAIVSDWSSHSAIPLTALRET